MSVSPTSFYPQPSAYAQAPLPESMAYQQAPGQATPFLNDVNWMHPPAGNLPGGNFQQQSFPEAPLQAPMPVAPMLPQAASAPASSARKTHPHNKDTSIDSSKNRWFPRSLSSKADPADQVADPGRFAFFMGLATFAVTRFRILGTLAGATAAYIWQDQRNRDAERKARQT